MFLPILSCLWQVSGIQLELLRKQDAHIISSFHVTGGAGSDRQCDYYSWGLIALERNVATRIFSPLAKCRFLAAVSVSQGLCKRLSQGVSSAGEYGGLSPSMVARWKFDPKAPGS